MLLLLVSFCFRCCVTGDNSNALAIVTGCPLDDDITTVDDIILTGTLRYNLDNVRRLMDGRDDVALDRWDGSLILLF